MKKRLTRPTVAVDPITEKYLGKEEIKDLETQHRTEMCSSSYDCVELGKYRALGDYDHLRDLVEAEKAGRLTVAQLQKNKPLTLAQLREMAGEPVWCAEIECYGIVKVETLGRWANIPYFIGVWHRDGVATNFEWDIKRRGLTLYRRKPEEEHKKAPD